MRWMFLGRLVFGCSVLFVNIKNDGQFNIIRIYHPQQCVKHTIPKIVVRR